MTDEKPLDVYEMARQQMEQAVHDIHERVERLYWHGEYPTRSIASPPPSLSQRLIARYWWRPLWAIHDRLCDYVNCGCADDE